MPLSLRRSRIHVNSNNGRQLLKSGTRNEKKELEQSINDDDDGDGESQTPKLRKKIKLSPNNEKNQLSDSNKPPVAVKGWNTCSTGFTPTPTPTTTATKKFTPKLQRVKPKSHKIGSITAKIEPNDSNIEYISDSNSDSTTFIPESPCVTPKKNEYNELEQLSLSISAPNTPDANEKKEDRGTTWIQQITWKPKTPEKTKPDLTMLFDSGKKKKPLKGGFADNLRKLQVREKSSKAIWQLEKTKSVKKADVKLFLLRVLELEKERGLIYAKCHVELSPNDKEPLDIVNLILNPKIVEETVIKTGSLISLHPPWQRLKLSSKIIIFPSPYLEVLLEKDANIAIENIERVLQEWNCPCRASGLHPNSCPISKGGGESGDLPPTLTAKPNINNSQPILKNIVASQQSEQSNSSGQGTPISSLETGKHRYSVLKQVEKSGGCDSQIKLATVQGKIESILHSNAGKTFAPKYQCLIKDEDGIFCLLDLPLINKARKEDDWSRILRDGIGLKYRFIGLNISQRLLTQSATYVFDEIKQVSGSHDDNIQAFVYVFKALHGDTKIKLV